MNFGLKSPKLFLRKTSFNFENRVTFDQGQRMTLTFDTHSTLLTYLAKCFKQVRDPILQLYPNNK